MKNQVKFKAGDKVYCPSISPNVLEVLPEDDWQMKKKTPIRLPTINDDIVLFLTELGVDIHSKMPVIVHATQENYELLSKLHPNVTFEPPPKRKEPREIIEAMLEAGYDGVPCKTDCKQYRFICVAVSDDPYFPFVYDNVNGEPDAFSSAIPYCYKTGKNIIDFVDGEVVLESENVG